MSDPNPDMTWRDVGRAAVAWEDLTEGFSFKLHSTLRYTGRFHYSLWEREIVGPDFYEKTGQFAPIYSMEIEVSDAPLDMREPMTIETQVRLGRTADAAGRTTRIVGQAEQKIRARSREGREIDVCRLLKHSVFTRPDGPKEQRRVRELHESLGLGPTPPHRVQLLTLLDLGVPPADFHPHPERRAFEAEDGTPHVWGYEQTDPNRHVHAMDYVKTMESFGWDHLVRAGVSACDHYYDACRILFRSPCFRGERYRRRGRFEPRDERKGGGGLILGQIHRTGEDGEPLDPSRPAVALQLSFRPSAHAIAGARGAE